eukprot:5142527-Amphidinium_carterae.1
MKLTPQPLWLKQLVRFLLLAHSSPLFLSEVMAAASRSTKPMKVAGKKTATKKSPKTVMKAKRVSKIASGRLAKAMVLKGAREKTSGGLKKDALMKNKRGKIVSKRAAAAGKD